MATVADLIFQIAAQEGVDPRLALEVAIQESRLNPGAVSPVGAIGVFQLMPATAAALGVNPWDVAENIKGGIRYLKQQLARFGDTARALAAYNWGPERVAAAGADWFARAPAETRNYVQSILGRLQTEYQVSVSPVGITAALVEKITGLEPWQKALIAAGLAIGVYAIADSLTD